MPNMDEMMNSTWSTGLAALGFLIGATVGGALTVDTTLIVRIILVLGGAFGGVFIGWWIAWNIDEKSERKEFERKQALRQQHNQAFEATTGKKPTNTPPAKEQEDHDPLANKKKIKEWTPNYSMPQSQRERHRQAYEATIKERESKLARVETGFLQEETQECEKCRQTNPLEGTFCIHCGNRLGSSVCSNCKTKNLPEAKFCMGCGQVR